MKDEPVDAFWLSQAWFDLNQYGKAYELLVQRNLVQYGLRFQILAASALVRKHNGLKLQDH